MVVIETDAQLVPGQIVRDVQITDNESKWQTATFQVLRVATKDEYVAYCAREATHQPRDPFSKHFYLVSMD